MDKIIMNYKNKHINIRISKFINWLQINNYRIVLYNSLFGFKDFRLKVEKLKFNKQANTNNWYSI